MRKERARILWHSTGRAYIEYAPQDDGQVVVTHYEDNQCGRFDDRNSYTCTIAEAQVDYGYWWRQG